MLVQVKKFNGPVGREYANQFIGAVGDYLKGDWSSFTGLFVTSGTFAKSFHEKLKRQEKTGVNYTCWDGLKLVRYILEHGIGIKYSVDSEFWNTLDPTLLNFGENSKTQHS